MRYFLMGVLFFAVHSMTGFSQDLILKYGEVVVNNDSIYLTGDKATELMEIRLSVTNNRATAVSLKLRKTEIQLMEGAESSFCWGECYTPFVCVSPMAITIQPMGCDRNSFVGDYRPFGVEGTSIVRYTFFDPSDTTFQQSTTVFYQIGGSGMNQNSGFEEMVKVYPNPASDFLRISIPVAMQSDCAATLLNIQGQMVINEFVAAGRQEVSLNIAELPAGLYFLTLSDRKGARAAFKVSISH